MDGRLTCDTCKWCERGNTLYECRVNPPSPGDDDTRAGRRFPRVAPDDWCAQHSGRREQKWAI